MERIIKTMNQTKEQYIAVLVIKTWRNSPALWRWFRGGIYDFFEYVSTFDEKTAEQLCKAHLAVNLVRTNWG